MTCGPPGSGASPVARQAPVCSCWPTRATSARAGDIATPYKGRNKPESQKAADRSHARLRGPGERANAQLKSWKILTKFRCCPHRAYHLAKAIHVLQTREANA